VHLAIEDALRLVREGLTVRRACAVVRDDPRYRSLTCADEGALSLGGLVAAVESHLLGEVRA
jgi:hypothetical protein